MGLGYPMKNDDGSIDVPLFFGDDPEEWISWVESFGSDQGFSGLQMMQFAYGFIEGDALAWYYEETSRSAINNWEEFKSGLLRRFGKNNNSEHLKLLSDIRQMILELKQLSSGDSDTKQMGRETNQTEANPLVQIVESESCLDFSGKANSVEVLSKRKDETSQMYSLQIVEGDLSHKEQCNEPKKKDVDMAKHACQVFDQMPIRGKGNTKKKKKKRWRKLSKKKYILYGRTEGCTKRERTMMKNLAKGWKCCVLEHSAERVKHKPYVKMKMLTHQVFDKKLLLRSTKNIKIAKLGYERKGLMTNKYSKQLFHVELLSEDKTVSKQSSETQMKAGTKHKYKNNGFEMQVLSLLKERWVISKMGSCIMRFWKQLESFLWFVYGKKLLDVGQNMQSRLIYAEGKNGPRKIEAGITKVLWKLLVCLDAPDLKFERLKSSHGLRSFKRRVVFCWKCFLLNLLDTRHKLRRWNWQFGEFHKERETITNGFKGLSKLGNDQKILSPKSLDVHILYQRKERESMELSVCHQYLKQLLATREGLLQKIAGCLICCDVKFHLKHRWKSRLLQTLSGLIFCVENVLLIKSFVKLLFPKNHKLLHSETGFCTQYNDLEQLSTEFQSSSGLDYFTGLIFIWNQVLFCGCEADHISSGICSIVDVYGFFTCSKLQIGDETQGKRLLVVNEITLHDNNDKIDVTVKETWVYNKPMIRGVFHLQEPPELIDIHGIQISSLRFLINGKSILQIIVQSGSYSKSFLIFTLRTR